MLKTNAHVLFNLGPLQIKNFWIKINRRRALKMLIHFSCCTSLKITLRYRLDNTPKRVMQTEFQCFHTRKPIDNIYFNVAIIRYWGTKIKTDTVAIKKNAWIIWKRNSGRSKNINFCKIYTLKLKNTRKTIKSIICFRQ